MINDPTDGVVTEISNWIINMTILNLFWFLLTLIGGVLFGWAPATVAIMAAFRHQIRNTDKGQIIKIMWEEYRKNFLKANLIGLIIKISSILLIFYSFTLTHWEGFWMLLFTVIFVIILITFIMITLFIFPVYIHYKLVFVDYFKYAFIIGLSYLHFAVIMGVSLVMIFWLFSIFPGILLVFAVSLPAMFITHLSLYIFEKIENKKIQYKN